MSDRKFAIKVLEDKGEIVIRCNGNSMRPIIAPKEAIHLRKVLPSQIRVGDAVFCRINGNLQVHLVSAIDKERFQISNNHGHVNGWIGPHSIFGLAVKIEDRVLVNDAELVERLPHNDAAINAFLSVTVKRFDSKLAEVNGRQGFDYCTHRDHKCATMCLCGCEQCDPTGYAKAHRNI